jgi:cell division transport system permease protein
VAGHLVATVPLRRDASSRYLPWIFAVMAYLACLSFAGLLLLYSTGAHWDQDSASNFRVQILPMASRTTESDVTTATELLERTPGVAAVHSLSREESLRLLEPWFEPGTRLDGMPLPRLIEVATQRGTAVDLAALRDRLGAQVPSALVDEPRGPRDAASGLGRSIEALVALVTFLIFVAMIVIVVFTTRVALTVHRDVVELLHLIGARDRDIARVFQRHAFSLGLRGGCFGLLLACGTLAALYFGAERLDIPQLKRLDVDPWFLGLLAGVPVVASLVAMLSARLTAQRVLGRLV